MILNDDCQDPVEEVVDPPGGGGTGNPKKLLWLYLAPLAYLDLGLVSLYLADTNIIDDIPWLTPSSPWVFLEPDPESDSFFTETYSDTTNTIVQNSSVVVKGVTAAKQRAIRELSNHCALGVVVVYESKEAVFQGADLVFLGTAGAELIVGLDPATITNVVTTSASSTDTSTIALEVTSVVRNFGSRLINYNQIIA